MNLKLIFLLSFLISFCILQTECRKVTQKPKKPAPPPPPPPPKKDKSCGRSKIDSEKAKYESEKQKPKSKVSSVGSHHGKPRDASAPTAQKTTTARRLNWNAQLKTTKSYGWNSNIQAGSYNSLQTTKKPMFDRLKEKTESRKVTQKPNKPASPPPPPPLKKDKSWIRTKIDSAKEKYAYNFIQTTKKPMFDRLKEKVKNSDKYVVKAVGWAKKDLGIGVERRKKPSKILKFGKKVVDYLFEKKTGRSSDLHHKVYYLRSRLETMQKTIQGTWNTSEAGTKYKLFEEKKNWNDAQLHCEELGSNLAYLDSESKNNYAKILVDSQNVTMVWFGLRTEVGSDSEQQSQNQFSNSANLDGCGTVDRNGTWSLSTCSIELPYLCQAFRFDVLVKIP